MLHLTSLSACLHHFSVSTWDFNPTKKRPEDKIISCWSPGAGHSINTTEIPILVNNLTVMMMMVMSCLLMFTETRIKHFIYLVAPRLCNVKDLLTLETLLSKGLCVLFVSRLDFGSVNSVLALLGEMYHSLNQQTFIEVARSGWA